MSRKVLVVGGGGREHALALSLLRSPSVGEVVVSPGNAGTDRAPRSGTAAEKVLRNAAGPPVDVALAERPDLVVVGPEAPLCDGVVDDLAAEGIVAYGPTRAAARLEGSKAFMKEFATRHGIPTAAFQVVTEADRAKAWIRERDTPPVVKADGLCAGKGVVVAADPDEAVRAARSMLSGEPFGDAGRTVVLEDRVSGAEASIHAICDGRRAVVLPVAQDHKRIGDGDTGPNTGGMGAYAPAPVVSPELRERIDREIVQRVVTGMAEEGIPFRGTLFAGLMISDAGEPMLLEINVRFGDPETQVLTSLLDGDFGDALHAAATGELAPDALRVADRHALCVVLASHGYPTSARKGDAIEGVDAADAMEGVTVFHAGTRREADRLVTAGGRVLGVTGVASSLSLARERAYAAAKLIAFDGKQQRNDIGARALGPLG